METSIMVYYWKMFIGGPNKKGHGIFEIVY